MPVDGHKLCALESVPDGGCIEFTGLGEHAILVIRAGEQLKAFVNNCPHFSLPLNSRPGEFLLMSGGRIMCAHHCSVFRLSDGRCTEGPAAHTALEEVAVTVRDGQVFV